MERVIKILDLHVEIVVNKSEWRKRIDVDYHLKWSISSCGQFFGFRALHYYYYCIIIVLLIELAVSLVLMSKRLQTSILVFSGLFHFGLCSWIIPIKFTFYFIFMIMWYSTTLLQDMAGLISKINRSSIGPLPSCYSPSM